MPRHHAPSPRAERLILLAFVSAVLAFVAVFALADPAAFRSFFAWPNGGVWSNLVASSILGVPALYAVLRKLRIHHQQHLDLLHRQHQQHLQFLATHHQAISQKLDPPA